MPRQFPTISHPNYTGRRFGGSSEEDCGCSCDSDEDEPHRKFPPILARFKGPAPNRYYIDGLTGFINHDKTKYLEPRYTMRPKTSCCIEKFPGPGPAIRQDRRFTRFGKVGTPVYTMRPFYPPLEADCVPGPPTYEWEKVHPYMEPHAPNYTMRRRTRYMLLPNNPAPNQYHLRTVIGRGQGCFPWEPGWTILEDNKYYTFQKDLAKTPGPASVRVHPKVMDRVGHYVRAPCYTIGRRTGPVEKSRAPGPNVYGPEFVTLHKPGIPELSFGERHSEFAGAMISRIDSKCLNLSQLLSRLPKPI